MPKLNTLGPVQDEQILSRIRFENPWWVTGEIDGELSQLQRRLYFDLFARLVLETGVKRAVVLMGPRRVGKTVMMQHMIQSLLGSGVSPQKIAFIGIDSPTYFHQGLERMFELARKASGQENADGWFVFFDEIQYLKDWERHLKVLVDSYPHTRFVVSGSASAALKMKSAESGAGRFTEFLLPPLTFHEYIHLKRLQHLVRPSTTQWMGHSVQFFQAIDIREVNLHFIDYLNFGGYPEVIFSETIRQNPGRYIKQDIVDKVLLRDLPSLYGIQDVQELNAFFVSLAYYSGQEHSLDSLANGSGVSKAQLKKYLEYLEAAFLVKVVHRIDDNARKFQRANFFKVFLTNPSIRTALFSPLVSEDDHFGAMVETTIFAQWFHRDSFTPLYARWSQGRTQGEVDMVALDALRLRPSWAVEVKWSNKYFAQPASLKSLLSFCKGNDLSGALVTTIDKEGVQTVEEVNLHFFPAAMYAYVVGENTLRQRLKD